MKTPGARFVFDSPAVYQILVEGRVAARWAESIGAMTICAQQGSGKPPTTTLTGVMVDQAALMGILTELYEMHCAVLEVRRLSESAASEPAASPPPEA